MRVALVLSLAVLGACSGSPDRAETNAVDINNAAQRAQNEIDRYSANTANSVADSGPPPSSPPSAVKDANRPYEPPAPGTPGGLPDDRTPVSEAPFTPDSAQGAADVVQRYYALIGEGRYRQAWALWDDGGRASGMSAAQFAASFARYAQYHAHVGAPGRIDAGAGQRHVSVPVQVFGRLKSAEAFNMLGQVTLHRVADIDGATPEQRTWHISASDVKPRPGRAADAGALAER